MSFSLFSRARRSTADSRRQVDQAKKEAGEFAQRDVEAPTPLTAEELRLVGGGEETSPKGGWALPTSTGTATTGH